MAKTLRYRIGIKFGPEDVAMGALQMSSNDKRWVACPITILDIDILDYAGLGIGKQSAVYNSKSVDAVSSGIGRWIDDLRERYGIEEMMTIAYTPPKKTSSVNKTIIGPLTPQEGIGRSADVKRIKKKYHVHSRLHVRKFQALERQQGRCLYCGERIGRHAQMDHVLAKSRVGSNSHFDNLVAACADCNGSKSDELFLVWQRNNPQVDIKEVMRRIDEDWRQDSWMSDELWKQYVSAVKSYLLCTGDIAPRKREVKDDEIVPTLKIGGFLQEAVIGNRNKKPIKPTYGAYSGLARKLAKAFRLRLQEGYKAEYKQDKSLPKAGQRLFIFSTEVLEPVWSLSELEKVAGFLNRQSSLGHSIDCLSKSTVEACLIAAMQPQIVEILTLIRKTIESGLSGDTDCKVEEVFASIQSPRDLCQYLPKNLSEKEKHSFENWLDHQFVSIIRLVNEKAGYSSDLSLVGSRERKNVYESFIESWNGKLSGSPVYVVSCLVLSVCVSFVLISYGVCRHLKKIQRKS
ncbi:HNH endonuclease [Bifidobacterium sp. ESL0764]|uniref:HNH endonuclease n=1 Tax=Bifidobacterium sp. ESL0764 TaxID=2983228 RepID=UPI0023F8567C|nr:HNH endonuclease [Bifidobacterium sp. ESL0764]WEV66405.1 HNH endonuclease [Bifidobacterium sp. ESL0764]